MVRPPILDGERRFRTRAYIGVDGNSCSRPVPINGKSLDVLGGDEGKHSRRRGCSLS